MDAILRHFGSQDSAHRLFGVAISNGDGRLIAFALRRYRLAIMWTDCLTRGIRKTVGERNFDGKVHGVPAGMLSGSPASDRKSTRLNSSHVKISYAVFCL